VSEDADVAPDFRRACDTQGDRQDQENRLEQRRDRVEHGFPYRWLLACWHARPLGQLGEKAGEMSAAQTSL
jgi:hypothetical protein